MLLDTFFMRYKADTGAAVKDVERLDKANEKLADNQKKNDKTNTRTQARAAREAAKAERIAKKTAAANKKAVKEQVGGLNDIAASGRDASRALADMGKGGTRSVGGMRTATNVLLSTLSKVGPAGAVAAAALAAVGGGLLVGLSGAEDARTAARDSAAFGQSAFDARLSNDELIRLQGRGRSRGLLDEETNASAVGVNDRSLEMRAAQRQAARDPASAFNNPIIKAANLWKKAGVDVNASVETQIAQQDKYLAALVKTGQEEKALIEGTQLFGRTLVDTKSVMANATATMSMTSVELAKESVMRRQLTKDSESLLSAENRLSIEQKRADDQILSKTVPATIKLTEAQIEWTKATAGLRESWALFVEDMIGGLTSLTTKSSEWLVRLGMSEGTDEINERIRIDDAGTKAEQAFIARMGGEVRGSQAGVKAAGDKAREAERKLIEQEKARALKPNDLGVQSNIMHDASKIAGVTQEELRRIGEIIKTDPAVKTAQEALMVAREQLKQQEKSGDLQTAQVDLDKKIESNTAAMINTGLEQAMSMWAAGVGKGASVGSGQFRGEERGHYEERMKMLLRTVQPNVRMDMLEARSTLGAAGQQAAQLHLANPQASAGGGVGGLNIEKLEVSVVSSQDATGMGAEIAYAVRDELRYAVNEFSDPRVS
jgi:hypothetical protein